MWVCKGRHCPSVQSREVICFLWPLIRNIFLKQGSMGPCEQTLHQLLLWNKPPQAQWRKQESFTTSHIWQGDSDISHMTHGENTGRVKRWGSQCTLPRGPKCYPGSPTVNSILIFFPFSEKINNLIAITGLQCLYLNLWACSHQGTILSAHVQQSLFLCGVIAIFFSYSLYSNE